MKRRKKASAPTRRGDFYDDGDAAGRILSVLLS